MINKRPKPEAIVTNLLQVEVLTGQGMPTLPVRSISRRAAVSIYSKCVEESTNRLVNL